VLALEKSLSAKLVEKVICSARRAASRLGQEITFSAR
jgi:hypothetical protein